MSARPQRTSAWLSAIVVLHLLVSLVHGVAHAWARVPLSRAGNLFVFVVILAGPLAGLAVTWFAARPGAWLIAAAMSASLAFGVVNHFVIAGSDHVGHVAAEWRLLFGATAVLLAVSEAVGGWLAVRLATVTRAADTRSAARA